MDPPPDAFVPIARLEPSIDASSLYVKGVVTLVWPYSSSRRSFSILLVEPDFRLRRDKGQIRINFKRACAKALARAGISSGDEIRLRLEGCRWLEEASTVETPGKSVGWELGFDRQVRLEVKRPEQDTKIIEVEKPSSPEPLRPFTPPHPRTPVDHASPISPISVFSTTSTWSTSALRGRRKRDLSQSLSGNPFAFIEDEDLEAEPVAKRVKFSRGGNRKWRIAGQDSSQEVEQPSSSAPSRQKPDHVTEDLTKLVSGESTPAASQVSKERKAVPLFSDSQGLNQRASEEARQQASQIFSSNASQKLRQEFDSNFSQEVGLEASQNDSQRIDQEVNQEIGQCVDQEGSLEISQKVDEETQQEKHPDMIGRIDLSDLQTYDGNIDDSFDSGQATPSFPPDEHPARLLTFGSGFTETSVPYSTPSRVFSSQNNSSLGPSPEFDSQLSRKLKDAKGKERNQPAPTKKVEIATETMTEASQSPSVQVAAAELKSILRKSVPKTQSEQVSPRRNRQRESPRGDRGDRRDIISFDFAGSGQYQHNPRLGIQIPPAPAVTLDTQFPSLTETVVGMLPSPSTLPTPNLGDTFVDFGYYNQLTDDSTVTFDMDTVPGPQDPADFPPSPTQLPQLGFSPVSPLQRPGSQSRAPDRLPNTQQRSSSRPVSSQLQVPGQHDASLANDAVQQLDFVRSRFGQLEQVVDRVEMETAEDAALSSSVETEEATPPMGHDQHQDPVETLVPPDSRYHQSAQTTQTSMPQPQVIDLLSSDDESEPEPRPDLTQNKSISEFVVDRSVENPRTPDITQSNDHSSATQKTEEMTDDDYEMAFANEGIQINRYFSAETDDLEETERIDMSQAYEGTEDDGQQQIAQPEAPEQFSNQQGTMELLGETDVQRETSNQAEHFDVQSDTNSVVSVDAPEGAANPGPAEPMETDTHTKDASNLDAQPTSPAAAVEVENPFVIENVASTEAARASEMNDEIAAHEATLGVIKESFAQDVGADTRASQADQTETAPVLDTMTTEQSKPERTHRRSARARRGHTKTDSGAGSSGKPQVVDNAESAEGTTPQLATPGADFQSAAIEQASEGEIMSSAPVIDDEAIQSTTLEREDNQPAAPAGVDRHLGRSRRSGSSQDRAVISESFEAQEADSAVSATAPPRRATRALRSRGKQSVETGSTALAQPTVAHDPVLADDERDDEPRVRSRGKGKEKTTPVLQSTQRPRRVTRRGSQTMPPPSPRQPDPASAQLLAEVEATTVPLSELPLTSGTRTDYAYLTPLTNLHQHVNSDVDALTIVVGCSSPEKSPSGPRDWHMTLYVTDVSLSSEGGPFPMRAVQIFRPTRSALPRHAALGNILLLQNFKCITRARRMMLLSTFSSGWVVLAADAAKEAPRVKIAGPPIDYGKQELGLAQQMTQWWNGLDMDIREALDDRAKTEVERVKEIARRKRGEKNVAKPGEMTHELRSGSKYPYTDTRLLSDEIEGTPAP